MISYNILGDCVSRDIVQPLIVKKEVLVQQFCSFSSPISLFSAKPEKMLLIEDLPGRLLLFTRDALCWTLTNKFLNTFLKRKQII